MAGLVLLGTLLLYYFIRSDKQSLTVQPENRFIQETEQLLAELSQGNKVTPQSLGLSSEYTQTAPLVADSSARKLSSLESQKEIPQVFTVPHQVNLTSEPQWEKELDLFLKGEGSEKGFLDSLSTRNWKQARDALALAYEEKKLPHSKNFQEKFWMKIGEVGGATVAEELLKEGDPALLRSSKDGPREVRRKCLITMPTWI